MPSHQFQLRGHSMESLRWQLFDQYGAAARIIRAEKIKTGGLFGLGAITSFEVLVELDPVPERAAGQAVTQTGSGTLRPASPRASTPTRQGIPPRGSSPRRSLSELLAAADDGDDARPSGDADRGRTPDFETILSALTEPRNVTGPGGLAKAGSLPGPGPLVEPRGTTGAAAGTLSVAVPRPLTEPGALVVLAGRRDQPLATAWSMAAHLQDGADVLTAGDHRHYGTSHVFLDSVEVKHAQAAAASAGKPLLIAFSFGQRGGSNLSMLGSVRAQQLWFVVDAAHKPEDTASWVGRACRYAVPDGLAVLGATDTATPESVNTLSIPVGWIDGRQATSVEL